MSGSLSLGGGHQEMGSPPETAETILAAARQRMEFRSAGRVPVDYAALNKMVRRQRSALTRAINSGKPERVVLAVRNAVRDWRQPGAMWPDDWAHWQRALDDVLPWNQRFNIEDLV